MYLKKGLYANYVRNSYNSTAKRKKEIQLKKNRKGN